MDLLEPLGSLWWALGLFLVLGSLTYLTLNKSQKDVVLSRLGFSRNKTRTSSTPPRSLTPTKLTEKAVFGDALNTYEDIFPPSRRVALADVKDDLPKKFIASVEELAKVPSMSRVSLAPHNKPWDSLDKPAYTATEFSIDEIKALGDFPDYVALSGIPAPQPYHNFQLEKALPRPYRPFRWSYHQTMSLTKLQPDWWLELESTYATRVRERQELYAKHGPLVMQSLPGSEFAMKELMEMCLQFYVARYPMHFRLDTERLIFYNDILKTETHLKDVSPFDVLLQNVPEDFAIMLRNPEDGIYHFRAGIICSSLGWSVGSKIGMKLHEIHDPIPDYKEKMRASMDRYFAKKPTDRAIQRGSWGLEVHEPLFMPPGDPHEALRSAQDPSHTISDMNLRVDWQTLRRLPLSGAVVFNFKGLFTPITEFRDEPYVPALVLKVLKEGKQNLMEYKGTWHTEHVVMPALEEWVKEQEEKGLTEKGWEPRTLDESPWFPGWEEKWHRQQGF
ncbi:MAG: hypothetical protein M1820_004732 [Bogoriella megaspora]|nr:MAG: hypothetical protein M1820_004732 [Bogoriella megaspora]